MDNPKTDYDKIDRYLRGEMSREETLLFKEEMAVNPELRSELETARHITEALDRKAEQGALQELLAIDSEKELMRAIGQGKGGRKKLRKYAGRVTFFAACAAIALMVYGYMPKYSSAELYGQAMSWPQYESFSARGGEELPEELQWMLGLAGELYAAEDYSGAVDVYERMFKEYGGDVIPEEARFYTGVSYLALKNYERAAGVFTAIVEEGSGYAWQGEWYLALTYLTRGERLTARETLENIVRGGEGPYVEDAARLIELIKTKRWL